MNSLQLSVVSVAMYFQMGTAESLKFSEWSRHVSAYIWIHPNSCKGIQQRSSSGQYGVSILCSKGFMSKLHIIAAVWNNHTDSEATVGC